MPEPVQIHCLGGFVATAYYGFDRSTNDLDYFEVFPPEAARILEDTAGPESALFKKYRLYVRSAGVVTPPESYAGRLVELFPAEFRKLRLLALEPHDLALSKLDRNNAVDRDDVRLLALRVPLDPEVLRNRYRRELRPIITGDVEKHDRTLEMWIAAFFPPPTE